MMFLNCQKPGLIKTRQAYPARTPLLDLERRGRKPEGCGPVPLLFHALREIDYLALGAWCTISWYAHWREDIRALRGQVASSRIAKPKACRMCAW